MQYIMLYSKFTEDYVQQNLAYPKVLTNGVGQPYEALHMILTPDKKYFTQTLTTLSWIDSILRNGAKLSVSEVFLNHYNAYVDVYTKNKRLSALYHITVCGRRRNHKTHWADWVSKPRGTH